MDLKTVNELREKHGLAPLGEDGYVGTGASPTPGNRKRPSAKNGGQASSASARVGDGESDDDETTEIGAQPMRGERMPQERPGAVSEEFLKNFRHMAGLTEDSEISVDDREVATAVRSVIMKNTSYRSMLGSFPGILKQAAHSMGLKEALDKENISELARVFGDVMEQLALEQMRSR